MSVGQQVVVMKEDGTEKSFRITKLFGFIGLDRIEIQEAKAGDIVAVTGMEDIYVGETICSKERPEALPRLRIDDPSLQLSFLVNNCHFADIDGALLYDRRFNS